MFKLLVLDWLFVSLAFLAASLCLRLNVIVVLRIGGNSFMAMAECLTALILFAFLHLFSFIYLDIGGVNWKIGLDKYLNDKFPLVQPSFSTRLACILPHDILSMLYNVYVVLPYKRPFVIFYFLNRFLTLLKPKQISIATHG